MPDGGEGKGDGLLVDATIRNWNREVGASRGVGRTTRKGKKKSIRESGAGRGGLRVAGERAVWV